LGDTRVLALANDWEQEWAYETNAAFIGWPDRRGIYTMRHPW
jgi:hypothetical protein